MTAALHLAGTLVASTWAVRPLARARWVWRAPRTAILLWQMLALTWVLSAVGLVLALGLAPYDEPIPAALLRWGADLVAGRRAPGFSSPHHAAVVLGLLLTLAAPAALAASWLAVLRVRRRHRDVLALVAREDSAAPGALVVDHPLAVAYCLPGIPPVVVLSSGALRALTRDQVLAVLAHEQTHVRERHDLVLLPFTALRLLVPRVRLVDTALRAVALLVEMRADEGACARQDAGALAAALQRFGASSAHPPAGALAIADNAHTHDAETRGTDTHHTDPSGTDTAITARLMRMTGTAEPLPAALRWTLLATGLVMVSNPLSFMVF